MQRSVLSLHLHIILYIHNKSINFTVYHMKEEILTQLYHPLEERMFDEVYCFSLECLFQDMNGLL